MARRLMAPPPGGAGGVLFDVDGTLVDSAYVHTLAWWQAFRQHQLSTCPWQRSTGAWGWVATGWWTASCRGPGQGGDAEIMPAHAGVFAILAVAARVRRRQGPACPVHAGGLAVALASARRIKTSASRSSLAADAFIHAATSSNDAEESKPAPDILVAALEAVCRRPTPSTWGTRCGT